MIVPEKAQRVFALLQSGDLQRAGLRDLCSLLFAQTAIPFDPSGAQNQDVAGLKAQALPIRRRLHFLWRDSVTLAGVERDAVRGGKTLKINQHATSGNASPRPIMNSVARIGFVGDLLLSHAVVKAILPMPEMPQAIPLRRRLRVEIVVNVVEDVLAPPIDRVTQSRAVEQRRIRSLQLPVHSENLAGLYQPGGGGHPFRRQQIQRSDLIVIAEYAPGRMRRIIRVDRQFVESWQVFR